MGWTADISEERCSSSVGCVCHVHYNRAQNIHVHDPAGGECEQLVEGKIPLFPYLILLEAQD